MTHRIAPPMEARRTSSSASVSATLWPTLLNATRSALVGPCRATALAKSPPSNGPARHRPSSATRAERSLHCRNPGAWTASRWPQPTPSTRNFPSPPVRERGNILVPYSPPSRTPQPSGGHFDHRWRSADRWSRPRTSPDHLGCRRRQPPRMRERRAHSRIFHGELRAFPGPSESRAAPGEQGLPPAFDVGAAWTASNRKQLRQHRVGQHCIDEAGNRGQRVCRR